MGYHNKEIEKGILGEFSKIKEEFEELEEAMGQGNHVMALLECSDLIGAIEAFAAKWNITLSALIVMMETTKRAFKDGERK